jgi:fructosamine-3-kinase
VFSADLADGRRVVVKQEESADSRLHTEGRMLDYLARHTRLPVPAVLHSDPHLLVLSHLPGSSRFTPAAEQDAADHLARLHSQTAPHYGLPFDTLIGGLPQPNNPSAAWIPFFREQRLWHRGRAAMEIGRLPTPLFHRLTRLCDHLDQWLEEPEQPALIHGDVWTTNVLADGDRISGFLDPALYYADPEIELAFITLFDTFGTPFFARYHDHFPIQPGFFQERRHLYNLYPLLVHVHLFGGGYVGQVDDTLRRFGC